MIINVISDYMNAIDKNITEFSELVGISRNSISNLIKKNNDLSSYKVDTLQKICDKLNIPVGYLIKYIDETISISSISLKPKNKLSIEFKNSQNKKITIIGKAIPYFKQLKQTDGKPIELPYLSLEFDLEEYNVRKTLEELEKEINVEVLSDSIAYRKELMNDVIEAGLKVFLQETYSDYERYKDIFTTNFRLYMIGMLQTNYSYQYLVSYENNNWRIERQLPTPIEIVEVSDFNN